MVRQFVPVVVAVAIGATTVFAAPVSQMYERSGELDSHHIARDNGLELLPRLSADDLISRGLPSTTKEPEPDFSDPSKAEAELGLKWVEKLRSLKKKPFVYPTDAGWIPLLSKKDIKNIWVTGVPKCELQASRDTFSDGKGIHYGEYRAEVKCTYPINNRPTHRNAVTIGEPGPAPSWSQTVDKIEDFFQHIIKT